MRRTAAPLAAVAAAALAAAGCGTPSADLFVVQRTGTIPGAKLTLLVDDGGEASCNGGPRKSITSDQLIEARDIVRKLSGKDDEDNSGSDDGGQQESAPAERDLTLPPGPNAIMRYRVRLEAGLVAFSDTSRGQPQAFYRLAELTRQIAKGTCKLAR